jgi:preprotein translocase subunit SecG
MNAVLLVIHMMVAAALVGTILLQRSEGGALGIGGGGGGFMSGRSAGNALTKTTAVLAAMFFATSLALTLLASHTGPAKSVLTPTGRSGDGSLPGLQLPVSPPTVPSGPPAAPAAPPPPPQ